ncbi:MAG: O-acetyl-ADP-ribose deacetylase [bacterium]|nr:MAG: O-acetyl-ADP-ribose deacetylase [bacterium]
MIEVTIGRTTLRLVQGDITTQVVDGIVNAANSTLLGGGGVDGAIHRGGGPAILAECREIHDRQGGCPTGEAVITTAGALRAKKVIHTVGPVWSGGGRGEPELLARCYRNSLALAEANGLRTVAFPSISTGAYRYPVGKAARVALGTVIEELGERDLDEVRFVLFSRNDLDAYAAALDDIAGDP